MILADSKAYPNVLPKIGTKMGNAHRHTALCAWCNRVRSASLVPLGQSPTRVIAVVARLSSFESGRQRNFAIVAIGDSGIAEVDGNTVTLQGYAHPDQQESEILIPTSGKCDRI